VLSLSAQAGITGRVIDLHGEPWRTEPRLPSGGQATACAACAPCCPGCTRLDAWVGSLGGYASARYIGLCNEAREATSSPGESWQYLEMAQRSDEEHAASPGRWLAEAIELANRQASRRADAAAAACLQQSAEIMLAVDELRADPRVARALEDPGRSGAEVATELRASMGLEARPATSYETTLPPVGDLARTIGLRT
jgi:hypothetical protein